jgi:hypothetical protein
MAVHFFNDHALCSLPFALHHLTAQRVHHSWAGQDFNDHRNAVGVPAVLRRYACAVRLYKRYMRMPRFRATGC